MGLSLFRIGALLLACVFSLTQTQAQEKFIVLASTTSTQDSGLFTHILPLFKASSGIDVRVVAQGTGQALATARKGDADVVFVHDAVAEKKFVEDGIGVDRREVMYNDFVLIGPKSDPAAVKANKNILDAFRRIASSASAFTSRGDKSGTHAAELRYWTQAQIDPRVGKGRWYRETGSGMGPTLNTASAMNAYAFADRGTWLSFKNRGELTILLEGDSRLFNQYGVMRVNPQKHPHVKTELAQVFVDWITSASGQAAIAAYKIEGQSVFFPNYLASKKPS
jgi:tungstate transport system substrate-binding protein